MAEVSFKLRLTDLPEVMWEIRQEMAKMLISAAKKETPEVRKFAKSAAMAFESGANRGS